MTAFDPPDWATDEFLKTINVEAKMLARRKGEKQSFPRGWTMTDAILFWWETEGRKRWLREMRKARAGSQDSKAGACKTPMRQRKSAPALS